MRKEGLGKQGKAVESGKINERRNCKQSKEKGLKVEMGKMIRARGL